MTGPGSILAVLAGVAVLSALLAVVVLGGALRLRAGIRAAAGRGARVMRGRECRVGSGAAVGLLLVVLALALSVLVGCGGAEERRLPSPPGPAPETDPPAETGGEVAARMAEILFRTDSLLATRVHGQRRELPPEVEGLPDPLAPTPELERQDFLFDAGCSGVFCSLTAVGDVGQASSGGVPDGFVRGDLNWVTRASSAWASRHGITLLEAQADVREATPDTPDMRSLGAWMSHSGFVFSHALSVDEGWETEWRYGLAGGDLAGTRPVPRGDAEAVWQGVMIGSSANGYLPLQGDVALTYDAGDASLDAVFSNIFDLANRQPHSVSLVRFDNVPVRLDGTFDAGARGNRIAGGFYGPGHSESVGTMEQLGIVGTFGALRQEGQ